METDFPPQLRGHHTRVLGRKIADDETAAAELGKDESKVGSRRHRLRRRRGRAQESPTFPLEQAQPDPLARE